MIIGSTSGAIAEACAAASALLCAVALVAAVVTRSLRTRRLAHEAALTDAWVGALLGTAAPVPVTALSRNDAVVVLALWNRMRAAVRGRVAARLEDQGRAIGLDMVAHRLLATSARADELINAVAAAGAMRDVTSRDRIERLAHRGRSVTLRAEALRALVRLGGVRALPVAVEVFATQPDWHPALIASVLEELPPDPTAGALAQTAATAARRHDADLAVRLLQALVAIPSPTVRPVVSQLLAEDPHPEVAAGCLRLVALVGDGDDAAIVRPFTDHYVWYVRAQAATALGSVGTDEDAVVLQHLLLDEEWWVRQRAAEALGRIAGLTGDELAAMFDAHPEVVRFVGEAYSPVAEPLR